MAAELDDTIELSFSDLGLPLYSFSSATELSIEDLDDLVGSIDRELSKTGQNVRSLLSRNLPVFTKLFVSTEEVSAQLGALSSAVDGVVSNLGSCKSVEGVQIESEERLRLAERKLERLGERVERLRSVKQVVDKLQELDMLMSCGDVEDAAAVFNEVEMGVTTLQEGVQGKAEEVEIKCLHLELSERRGRLALKLRRLGEKMISFHREQGEVRVRVETVLKKSLQELEAVEKVAVNDRVSKADLTSDRKKSESTNELKMVLAAMYRLNILDRFMTETVGRRFLEEVLLEVVSRPQSVCEVREGPSSSTSLVITFPESQQIKAVLRQKVELDVVQQRWEEEGKGESFVERLCGMIQNVGLCMEWLTVRVLEQDDELIQSLPRVLWGRSSLLKSGTIKAEDRRCLSYVLLSLLYHRLPTTEHFLFNGDLDKVLTNVRGFEGMMQEAGVLDTGLFPPVLTDLVLNTERKVVDRKRDELLSTVREVIKGDYYATTTVSEATVRCSLSTVMDFHRLVESGALGQGEKTEQLLREVRKEGGWERRLRKGAKDDELFWLAEREVSSIAVEVVRRCHEVMDGVVLRLGKSLTATEDISSYYVQSMCQVVRESLLLFLLLTPVCHEKLLLSSAKYALVFHNDCAFLAHTLCTFSFTYHQLISPHAPNFTLIDLIPRYRAVAASTFQEQMTKACARIHSAVEQVQAVDSRLPPTSSLRKLQTVEGIVAAGKIVLKECAKEWKGLLCDAKFIEGLGALSEYSLQQLLRFLLFTKATEGREPDAFNVLELMNVKAALTDLLRAVESSVQSETCIVSREEEAGMDTDEKLQQVVKSFAKVEMIKDAVNETLSLSIWTDMADEGKLFKLTKEEIALVGRFLFPSHHNHARS